VTLSLGVAPLRSSIVVTAAGTPQVFEWQARNRSGQLFWVEVNMRSTVIAGQGRKIHWLVYLLAALCAARFFYLGKG